MEVLYLDRSKLIPVDCTTKRCPLYKQCSQVPTEVIGRGNVKAIFVGEGGGYVEGALIRPFCGRAGMTQRKIVDVAMRSLGMIGSAYALSNVCRFAPGYEEEENRSPTEEEVGYCLKYLKRDILKLNPEIVILTGKPAIKAFFPGTGRVSDARGTSKVIAIDGKRFRAFRTYHVSYGLRNPDSLGTILEDTEMALGKKREKIDVAFDNGVEYKLIHTPAQVNKALGSMYNAKRPVALDTESKNVTRLANDLLTIQLTNNKDFGYVIPLNHQESPISSTDLPPIKNSLTKFFNGGKYPYLLGHGLKFEYIIMLTCLGIRLGKPLVDTMCGGYLLNENYARDSGEEFTQEKGEVGGYALTDQLSYYGFYDKWYWQAKQMRSDLSNQPLEFVSKYGASDVVLNWDLLRCQLKTAKSQNYLRQFVNLLVNFYSYQIKLFSDMEINGLKIDEEYLSLLSSKSKSPIISYMNEILEEIKTLPSVKKANKKLSKNQRSVIFGDVWLFDFTKASHKQTLYFDILKLKPLKVGKEGPSLDKDFQKKYKDDVREVELLSEFTRAKQLYGLYVKKFRNILATSPDSRDGRLRPSNSGTRTRTGRGTTTNPNTQQTVREKDDDKLVDIVRGLIVSEPDNVIVDIDLNAAEIRNWGDQSGDPNVIKSFMQGKKLRDLYFETGPDEKLLKRMKKEADFHYTSAANFYGKKIEKVTDKERQDSKGCSFGTIYGLSVKNLAKGINKSKKAARKIQNSFFELYAVGKRWLDNICKFARKNFYVETPLGRRRRLWYYLIDFPLSTKRSTKTKLVQNTKDRMTLINYNKGNNRAKNSPIQATSSDLAYIGAFLLRGYIEHYNKPWKILNTVHDSVSTEVPVEDIKEFILVAKVIFERMVAKYVKQRFKYEIRVPVEVEFKVGFSLNKLKKWDGAKATLSKFQAYFVNKNKKRYREAA
jgi:uracil-DNA glycosylase family 4